MDFCVMNNIINKNKTISNGTRKNIVLILLIIFGIFIGTKTVFAVNSYGGVFGGRIMSTKALEIEEYESMGYVCPMYGYSFSIIPIGSPVNTPTNFFVPYYVIPKSGNSVALNKLTMGKYNGITTVACILMTGTGIDVKPVRLYTINLFGLSGR